MVVSILGCGWYGKALARALLQKGMTVKGSATSAEKLEALAASGIIPFIAVFDAGSQDFDPEFFAV